MLSLLLAVPSCIYSFWHGVIPTSYFIFNDFYTCIYNIKVVSAYCPHSAHFRSICLGSVSVLRHYHAIFIPCVQLWEPNLYRGGYASSRYSLVQGVLLTLGVHAQEGYCSCLVCVCVGFGVYKERRTYTRTQERGRLLSASLRTTAQASK